MMHWAIQNIRVFWRNPVRTASRVKPAFALVALLVILSSTLAGQKDAAPSSWTPPTPRKAKTPFAPKPLGGDNIFKGEGEKWLAEAIVNLEAGFMTPVEGKHLTDYISEVGRNLVAYSVAPAKQYEFIVIEDSMPNAMTAGGGRIYITHGILEALKSEDELAAVLAHEIAHDAFAHAPQTMTRQLFWMTGTRKLATSADVETALERLRAEYREKPLAAIGERLLGFARFQELEADRAAFYNVYKAGYNPAAVTSVLKRLERDMKEQMGDDYGWYQFLIFLFGSHPPTPQRSMALSWESNFIKMPPRDAQHQSAAFNEMKDRIAKIAN